MAGLSPLSRFGNRPGLVGAALLFTTLGLVGVLGSRSLSRLPPGMAASTGPMRYWPRILSLHRAVSTLRPSWAMTPDWHDYTGARYLLDHGADPNRDRKWGLLALHHSIARDNDITLIELLLERGADPTRTAQGHSAAELAAQRGRGDVLAAFDRRGVDLRLTGVDALVAACARGQESALDLARQEPMLLPPLLERGGTLLAQFAGTGNHRGIGLLLDLGVSVAAEYAGDGYFGTPAKSTPLHVAAWRARHRTVELLIARGAPIDAKDGNGRTPLELAVRACVESYWADRRRPDSIRLLLEAGASTEGVPFPSGYAEADQLLGRYR